MGKWIVIAVVLGLAGSSMARAQANTCEGLRAVKLDGMSVTSASNIAAGAEKRFPRLPAFCKVAAILKPTSDSEIRFELWMPKGSAWNGKYLGTGNGGWGGAIEPGAMAAGLMRGYAASSTDTGHSGGSASFATGHPEKLIDFGYRSVHDMTKASKALIAAYYGDAAKLAYFQGCSSGGRQALMEAQRYPADYDGIIAGSATNNWTAMMFGRMWVAQATLINPASYIPPAKYPMIHRAALAACDAMDGVKDGVLSEPMKCHFDPGVLACKGDSDDADCLTKAQLVAARKIYTPATNPRTGAEIFPPMERGSELVWGRLAGGPKPIQLAEDYFKYVVFEDPNWDFKTLNFDGDVATAMQRDGGVLSATNPNLGPFFTHGGKLLQYHGWTDQQVMPENSINYYNSVVAAVGSTEVSASYRLFMAPGMNHCGGGDGPNTFDMLGALEAWREGGSAPSTVVASHSTHGKIDRTRPLCAYPQIAKYRGSGSTDEAANFACSRP